MGVEALIAQPAVERLDEGVLDRAPGTDEVESDASSVRPGMEMAPREFGSVVERHDARLTALRDDTIEHQRHPRYREMCGCLEGQTLAREDVEHREDPEPPAIDQGVRHEV